MALINLFSRFNIKLANYKANEYQEKIVYADKYLTYKEKDEVIFNIYCSSYEYKTVGSHELLLIYEGSRISIYDLDNKKIALEFTIEDLESTDMYDENGKLIVVVRRLSYERNYYSEIYVIDNDETYEVFLGDEGHHFYVTHLTISDDLLIGIAKKAFQEAYEPFPFDAHNLIFTYDLKTQKIKSLKTPTAFLKVKKINEQIFGFDDKNLFYYDSDLKTPKYLNLPNLKEAIFLESFLMFMEEDSLKLLDLNNLQVVDSVKDVKLISGMVLCQGKTYVPFILENDKGIINGKEYPKKLIAKNPDFEKRYFGNYNFKYRLKNLEFTEDTRIDFYATVKDKRIYPLSYKLDFNGEGFLNNERIYRNYTLEKEGRYELLVKGNGDERKLTFFVSDGQISYFDKYTEVSYDFLTSKNTIELSYKLNDPLLNIKKIILNNQEITDFNVEGTTLIFNAMLDTNSIEELKIHSLIYEEEGQLKELVIESTVKVKKLKKTPSIITRLVDNVSKTSINYQIGDEDETVRGILVRSKSFEALYPFKSQVIDLGGMEGSVELFLAYDLGNTELELEKILSFVKTGSYTIDVKRGDNLKEEKNLQVSLRKSKSLEKLELGEKNIYTKETFKPLPYIMIGGSLGLLSFIVTLVFFISKRIKNKRLKDKTMV